MISAEEIRRHAGFVGVPEAQIVRDHLISHVIDALSREAPAALTFFGGTALCRTWLPDVRLSEDIDLLVEDHVAAGEELPPMISRGIRREFPDARWLDFGRHHDVDTKSLTVADDTEVRVQFVKWRAGWKEVIPVTLAPVRLRYSDLPDASDLTVPTPVGFAAMKLMAWSDRHAPRDLFDLYGLAEGGFIDEEVLRLHKSLTGVTPTARTLEGSVPSSVNSAWKAELAHQLGDLPSAETCLESVRNALLSIESHESE